MFLFLPKPTEQTIAVIAGILIASAQVIFLKDVYKKKVRPSLFSWIGWTLLMGTSLVSQIMNVGWQWSLAGLLLSTIGCILIFFTSLGLNQYLLKKSDWKFLALGLICLMIYLFSKDPWVTTVFAILADFLVGIPTIENGYRKPETQKTIAWTLGLISWSFSLVICIGHDLLYALFPIYLFLFNGTMVYLTRIKSGS